MAVRTFVFCDHCNPKGYRSIEERRAPNRGNGGRRLSDGRAWFEGTVDDAVTVGWVERDGLQFCPHCAGRRR